MQVGKESLLETIQTEKMSCSLHSDITRNESCLIGSLIYQSVTKRYALLNSDGMIGAKSLTLLRLNFISPIACVIRGVG